MTKLVDVQAVLTRTHCPVCGQGRFDLATHQHSGRSDCEYDGTCQSCGDQFDVILLTSHLSVTPSCPCCNAGSMDLTMIFASIRRRDQEVYYCHGCGHAATRSVSSRIQSSAL